MVLRINDRKYLLPKYLFESLFFQIIPKENYKLKKVGKLAKLKDVAFV